MILAVSLLILYFVYSFMYGVVFGNHIGPYVIVYAVLGMGTVIFCWYIAKVRRSNDV